MPALPLSRVFQWWLSLFISTGFAVAQSLTLDPPRPQADGTQLQLRGPVNTVHRLDTAARLPFWSSLELLTSTAATKTFLDPETNAPTRFYRAVEVERALEVLRVTPLSGEPGDEVILEGQFFVAGKPGDHVVTFGGATSVVATATSTRLTVRVPADAKSGLVVVRTATEAAGGPATFTVLKRVPVRVEPPGTRPASEYVVVNTYDGARASGLPVRQGVPLISMAVPTNDARGTLLSVTVEPPPVLVFNAASTAEALVFLHPLFQTSHRQLAVQALSLIHAAPEVAALGQLMHGHFAAGLDPTAQPDFTAAYSNAVFGVSRSSAMRRLAQEAAPLPVPTAPAGSRARRANTPVTTADVADFPVDADWIEVSRFEAPADNFIDEVRARLKGKIVGDPLGLRQRLVRRGQSETYPYATTVDWVVRIDEVDVEAAFPGGRPMFNAAWQESDSRSVYPSRPSPAGIPAEEAFPRFGAVGAKTFNEVTVPVKTLTGFALGKLQDNLPDSFPDFLKPPKEEITFPDRDALYRVTAVGPSFASGPELATATTAFADELRRAYILNLMAVVMESISVAIDIKGLMAEEDPTLREELLELFTKVGLEAGKKLPAFRSADELAPAAVDLVKFALGEFADLLQGKALEHFEKLAEKKGREALAGFLENAAPVLKALDIGGGIGQIALRIRGITVISPLETTFVVVGDPFQLQFLDITPAAARPGDEVVLRFRGPPGLAQFGRRVHDTVEFLGPDFFEGEVLSVTGPDADGIQAIRLRVPAGLPVSAEGSYEVSVQAGGRTGRGAFHLAPPLLVSAVTPSAAFAPAASFLGAAYLGEQVRLTGATFNRKDRFILPTADGEVVAAGVTDNRPDGDVSFKLPAGVVTGPIRVEHLLASGGTLTNWSPVLTILGPPVIQSVSPEIGMMGATVTLKVLNLGNQTATVGGTFGGTRFQPLSVSGDTLVCLVPAGATTGDLVVETPAGRATGHFSVIPGLTSGATIQVGGNSPITFEVAAGMANGTLGLDEAAQALGFPVFDDNDGPADPPAEPGDFVTDNLGFPDVPRFQVGAAFRNFIALSGSLAGDHTMRLDGDSLSGTIGGTLTVEGSGGFLSLTVEGTLIIRGHNHVLNRPKGPGTLIVEGDNNVIAAPEFSEGPGHGLIVRGNGNRVTGANFSNRGGDGLRIEGGKFNQIEVNLSVGNQGNGIVLTDGAEGNEVKFYTGRLGARSIVEPGTGNVGHGLLLLGDARNNRFSHYNGGSSGNLGDGIRLDGPNVTGNIFSGHLCSGNGGNGITLTNRARNNSFGSRNATGQTFSNALSGFAIYGSSGNELASVNTANGQYGLLVSGVDDRVGGRPMLVASGLLSADGTNGRAGLRLEESTKGVRVDTTIGDLRRNHVGVEIAGADTRFNSVNVSVRDAVRQGVVVTDAADNDLTFKVSEVGGNGVELRAAQNNSVRLFDIQNCGEAGLHLVGAAGNYLFCARAEPFNSTVSGVGNGIVVADGSERNLIERLNISSPGGAGIVLRDPGTSRNQVIRCNVNGSATDGIQLLAGASLNRLGDEQPTGFNPFRLAIQNNALAGVRVSGAGTDDNEIQFCNFARQAKQGTAIVIENQAGGTLVRSNQFLSTPNGGSGLIDFAVIVRDGARGARITRQRFSQIGTRAVLVSNATDVVVGGPAPADQNLFDTQAVGVELTGPDTHGCLIANNHFQEHTAEAVRLSDGAHNNEVGPGNSFDLDATGVAVLSAPDNEITGNSFTRQQVAAVAFEPGAAGNRVHFNTLTGNAAGIRVRGDTAVGNAFLDNVITGSAGKGIALLEGANAGIRPPAFTEFIGDVFYGTAAAPEGSLVQVFLDAKGEGQLMLGEALVVDGKFEVLLPRDPLWSATLLHLNATVTDPDGNTSEFSESF